MKRKRMNNRKLTMWVLSALVLGSSVYMPAVARAEERTTPITGYETTIYSDTTITIAGESDKMVAGVQLENATVSSFNIISTKYDGKLTLNISNTGGGQAAGVWIQGGQAEIVVPLEINVSTNGSSAYGIYADDMTGQKNVTADFYGDVTINGVKKEGTENGASGIYVRNKKVTMYGATNIEKVNGPAIVVDESAEINLNGGTIKAAAGYDAVYVDPDSKATLRDAATWQAVPFEDDWDENTKKRFTVSRNIPLKIIGNISGNVDIDMTHNQDESNVSFLEGNVSSPDSTLSLANGAYWKGSGNVFALNIGEGSSWEIDGDYNKIDLDHIIDAEITVLTSQGQIKQKADTEATLIVYQKFDGDIGDFANLMLAVRNVSDTCTWNGAVQGKLGKLTTRQNSVWNGAVASGGSLGTLAMNKNSVWNGAVASGGSLGTLTMTDDSAWNITAGSTVGTISSNGNIQQAEGTTPTLTVTEKLEGDVGTLHGLALTNNAVWTGNVKENATVSNLNMTSGTSWTHTGDTVSNIGTLTVDNASINAVGSGAIHIGSYSGSSNVYYTSASDELKTSGGNVIVDNVIAPNSSMKLNISADNLTPEVKAALGNGDYEAAMGNLAKKLTVNGGSENLTAKVVVSEGLTTPKATADIVLTEGNGNQNALKEDSPSPAPAPKPEPEPAPAPAPAPGPDDKPGVRNIEIAARETAVMRGVESAVMGSAMVMRAESNDLMKRMGDLRFAGTENGAWVKFYRGRSSSNEDNLNYKNNYTAIQAGYDYKPTKDWTLGMAVSHMTGSASYTDGSGESRQTNFGIYGSWQGKNGEYADFIGKIGKINNTFDIVPTNLAYSGNYKPWMYSLSAEVGKRIRLDSRGSFIEPQAELNYSHVNSYRYNGTGYIGGSPHDMGVRMGAYNSLVGRAGIGIGQENDRGSWMFKVSLCHEFAGNMDYSFSEDGVARPSVSKSGHDTWAAFQLGGTYKVNKNSYIYGNLEKTAGGKVNTDWRIDIGYRISL